MLLSACVMSHSQCLPSPGCTQDSQSTQPTSSIRQGMYTNLYQNRLRGAVRCKPAYMVCAKYCQSRKWNRGHTHKSTWLEYFGSTELQSLLRKGFASGFCTMKPSLLYKMLFFKSRMVDNSYTSERCHWTTAASWICTFSIYLHNTQYFNNQRRTPALASRRDRSWRCSQPTMSSTSYSPPFSSCTSSGATSSSKLPTRWGLITCRQRTRYKKTFLSGDVGRWYSDGHKESVRELQWLVTRNWKIFILFFE